MLDGDAVQGAGAGVIDGDGEQKNGEGPDGEGKGEMLVEEDAADGFGENPDAGGEHQEGLDEGGEAFDLSVTVVVIFVGGPVGDLDGEEGDRSGAEVDAGVCGLGEHAQRAGEQSGQQLEQGNDQSGEDRQQRGRTLGGVGMRCFFGRCNQGHERDATWCGFGMGGLSLCNL